MNTGRAERGYLWRAPMDEYPELLLDQNLHLLKVAMWSVMAGAAVFSVLLMSSPREYPWRIAVAIATMVLAAAALLALQFRGPLPATWIIIAGSWLIVTAVSMRGDGVHTPLLVAYPIILVFAGWMLGLGASIVLFGASSVMVVVLTLQQALGWGGSAVPVPLSSGVTHLVVMALSVLMTLYLVRVFRERYAEMRRLNSQNLLDLQAAQVKEADLRMLAEHMPGLVFECDAQGRCVFVNQRLLRFFARSAPNLANLSMVDLLGDGPHGRSCQSSLLRGEVVEFGMRKVAPDGAWCNVEVTLVPKRAEDSDRVVGWYGLIYDVTRREQAVLEMRDKATRDPLTGLANRLLFMDRLSHALDHAIRKKKRVAVLFVDLDDFKRVNDTMGHATGDAFLREIARRLTATIRSVDTVARLGGDEFVVLVEEVRSAETAALIADKILGALTQPVMIEGRRVVSGASIGIALGPDGRRSGDELLHAADIALYEAKAAGRKCYRIFSGSNAPVSRSDSRASRPAPL